MKYLKNKKLIEVALPISELNEASSYDKMPGIGPHPKGIHHWWARLPLPAARAIIFASVVDDPSCHPDKWPSIEAEEKERERLLEIVRSLMENQLHKNPSIYSVALKEMKSSCEGKLPQVYDPFSGGGSIPLEASRLGLTPIARDLNPVAVLINKCNLEIVPKYSKTAPINPEDRKLNNFKDSKNVINGLVADVMYYGGIIANRAWEKNKHYYPKVNLPPEIGKGESEVISWVWARTVPSPNPSLRGTHVPLIKSFWLSNINNKKVWLVPKINRENLTYEFDIQRGNPEDPAILSKGTKLGKKDFKCIFTGDLISAKYIKEEANKNSFGLKLLAIVTNFNRTKQYIPSTADHERVAFSNSLTSHQHINLPEYSDTGLNEYGISQFTDFFTHRQFNSMVCLSDCIKELRTEILNDSAQCGVVGNEASEYAKAITTILALALDRCADFNSSFCCWLPRNEKVMHLFNSQFIPMVTDFAEANIFGSSVGSWETCYSYVAKCVKTIFPEKLETFSTGLVKQCSATNDESIDFNNVMISTDPPYYDNIGYAKLSDFFYVWLRMTLQEDYPDLFDTLLVPKKPELTAMAERFDGNKLEAKLHFETGFKNIFSKLRENMNDSFPLTVYYAFKQADDTKYKSGSKESNQITQSTGWETMLNALITSGFQITGTWPVTASQKHRMRAIGTNALASYIVLVCRPRVNNEKRIGSNHFREELKRKLPTAIRTLRLGKIPPVDFAQAAIGPGMSIYSSYGKILDPSGSPLSVRDALSMINQTLAEVLKEGEVDFDRETQWAITWFDQYGFNVGPFGDAEVLGKAKAIPVRDLEIGGIVNSKGGEVNLINLNGLSDEWTPALLKKSSIWFITHQLLRISFHKKLGDVKSAEYLREIKERGQDVRQLVYLLYDICERKKRSSEAQAYNSLIAGWSEIEKIATNEQNFLSDKLI